jgi:hypothetical protein
MGLHCQGSASLADMGQLMMIMRIWMAPHLNTEQPYYRPPVLHHWYSDNKVPVIAILRIKRERELETRPQNNRWAFKRVAYVFFCNIL